MCVENTCHDELAWSQTAVVGSRRCAFATDANVRSIANAGIAYVKLTGGIGGAGGDGDGDGGCGCGRGQMNPMHPVVYLEECQTKVLQVSKARSQIGKRESKIHSEIPNRLA